MMYVKILRTVLKTIISLMIISFISCEPIELRDSIDELVLGWSREITLTSPEDEAGIAEKTPLLDWEDAGGATGYEIQISDSDSFDGINPIAIKGDSEYEFPEALTLCDRKYWRVRGVQNGEKSDKWSETRSFDVVVSPTPRLVGTLVNGGSGFEFVVDGNYAYIANGMAGLQIVDLSEPSNPRLIYTISGEVSKAVFVRNQHLYFELRGNPNRLMIYDVSDPTAPALKGSCNTEFGGENYESNSIAAWADYQAIIAAKNKGTVGVGAPEYGILRVDLNDPSNPSIGSEIVEISGGEPWVLDSEGTTAAITVNSTGLLIYDMPSRNIVGQYSIPDQLYGSVVIENGNAYVSNKNGPLRIISLTDTTNPVQINTYTPAEDTTAGISISGYYAFIVREHGDYEMHIVDIHDLNNLELVTTTPKFCLSLNGNYGYAQYIIDGEFYVIDLIPED